MEPVSGSIRLGAWQRPKRGGAADPRLLTKNPADPERKAGTG